MKAVVLDAILSSFSSRKDRSLGFRVSTPELATTEKVALMDLEGLNVKLLIQPQDGPPEEMVTVKSEMKVKTPSQRLRGILFIRFQQTTDTNQTNFEQFYQHHMNRICEAEKAGLEKAPF